MALKALELALIITTYPFYLCKAEDLLRSRSERKDIVFRCLVRPHPGELESSHLLFSKMRCTCL